MGIDAEIDVSQGGDVIQTLKDEIYCSICCSIFQDPLKLDCCDGHLCRACFDDVKIKFPSCPLCRAPEYTAKPSRLMVSVLSTITLCCPAEECNEKILYSQFMKHKETCVYLNMKTCDQCTAKMEFEESKRHLNCVESLLNDLNKLKDENEVLKKSNEAEKKAKRALRMKNEIEKKQYEAEMKKYEATKVSYAGLTIKHKKTLDENKKLEKSIEMHKKTGAAAEQKADEKLKHDKTLAENIRSKSHIKNLERSTEILKKNAVSAKQKADEKLKESELKSYSVIEALKAEIKVLRSRNIELVEENKTKNESEESKFSATGAALQNKVEQLTEWLDKNDNEKSAIQAEVLKLQNQMTEMEKKVAGLTVKHTKTLEEKKKAEKSCVKYKKIAAQQSAAKQKADEKLKQSKLKSNSVIEALKTEIKVLRSRNVELVEESKTKTELYESKIAATKAALQKDFAEMEKKVEEKNDQISQFRNVLSLESTSLEVIKLKNEIGRVEQSAILYFQMYMKEKKLNQEMQSRITSCFSCSSSLIFKICPK